MGSEKIMDIMGLSTFLEEQATCLAVFLDFEPIRNDPDSTSRFIDDWFNGFSWRGSGYQIIVLGKDGTGSLFIAWLWPFSKGPAPIAFLGSEGTFGVLAPDASAFVQALSHGPRIASNEGIASFQTDMRPRNALERRAMNLYRRAIEALFGPVPPLEICTDVPGAVQNAFIKWIAVHST